MSACQSSVCRAVVICIIIALGCPRSGHMIFTRRTKAVITANATAYTIGESANFECRLKTHHYTVYDLSFVSVPASLASRGTTRVLDNATLTLSVTSLSVKDTATLYCTTSNTTLARKKIFVGAPPVAAYNISCISYNQVQFECVVPVASLQKQIQARWTIEYTNRGLGGVYTMCNRSTICVLHINKIDDTTTNNNIFYPALHYTFRVNATNLFGRATKTFNVDPLLAVKPDPVKNVTAWVLNSTCLNVTWGDVNYSGVTVRYTVTANSQQVLVPEHNDSDTHWAVLCDLHPYSKVVVSVTSRPLHGGHPSYPTSTTQLMPEDRPSSPVVQAGSYTTLAAGARRKVAVYWQAVPDGLQHGVIRGFRVIVHRSQPRRNTSIVAEQSVPNTSVSALVEVDLSISVEYVVSVQAWTNVGYSDVTDAARIHIPVAFKKQTTAGWVDAVLVNDGVYDIYWDTVFTSATSTTRLHWCYGQMMRPGYVSCELTLKFFYHGCTDLHEASIAPEDYCFDYRLLTAALVMKTSIQARVEGEAADGNGAEVEVGEKFVTTCSTCVWHFGVSMEKDGINSGILWNQCMFQKFKAPLVNDVVVSRLTKSSVLVTWSVPCLMSNYGRPEFIDVSVIAGSTPGGCEDSHPVRVTAKHGDNSVTLKVGSSYLYTVCVRAVGGGKQGPWVRRNVTGSVDVVHPGVIVGVPVSCSTLAAAIIITSIYFCRRKKWFAKIQIQLPTLINHLGYPAPEEGRFLPSRNVSSENSTATTVKGSHRGESRSLSNLESRNETVGTGLLTYVIAGDDVSRHNSIDICVDISSLSSVDGNTERAGERPGDMAKTHRLRASNVTLQGSDSDSRTGCGGLELPDVWLQGSCGYVAGTWEFPDYNICAGDPCDTDGDDLACYHSCSFVRDPAQYGVGKKHGVSDSQIGT